MERHNGVSWMRKGLGLTVLLIFFIVIAYNAIFSFSYSVGPNYRNVSVDTFVNITNAGPIIHNIFLPQPGITLKAGNTTLVQCNVTVEDYNGASDINYTEAVFYHSSSTSGAADDNNSHYTNGSCAVSGAAGDFKNFTCGFYVMYHAFNGTWTCNATTYDNHSYNYSGTNTTAIYELLALNVSTQLIDYGNLSVGDYSTNQTANVSNIGNVDINVSVRGYGLSDNDGLAFDCDQGNISIDNEHFSVNASHDWASKSTLSGTYQNLGLTVQRQSLPGSPPENETYWQIYVPPNPFGVCTGTVVFQAESTTPG